MITVRNTITGERQNIQPDAGKSVRQTIASTGLVHGDFSTRDKNGHIVDDEPIETFDGKILDIGLPGEHVRGG